MTSRITLHSLLCCLMLCAYLDTQAEPAPSAATAVMYQQDFTTGATPKELIFDSHHAQFEADGLHLKDTGALVRLDRYYALSQRSVRYHVSLSADTRALFCSDSRDFMARIDMATKTISINATPSRTLRAEFLNPVHEYMVEIIRDHNASTFRITDLNTAESAELSAVQDGGGGYGAGMIGTGNACGMQHDYYCFGIEGGREMIVHRMCVLSALCNLTLLLYGDSITEPDNYFPDATQHLAWTRLVMGHVRGGAMASGRGGCTINEVLLRIRNELPYIKAKYVMVTIGTNGGNTEQNLSELVEYIRAQGSIPLLNNIPSNEHGTQVEVNAMIEKIRQKYRINGCRFDWATSLGRDGKQVDTSAMWYEDYGPGNAYYHHPNVKGAQLMYLRTLIDTPEIYQ